MKTRLNIVGLKTVVGDNYVVGQPLNEAEDNSVVSNIAYNRVDNPYNKGFQLSGASYTIKLSNNDEVRILVPQSAVASIAIHREQVQDNPEDAGLVG